MELGPADFGDFFFSIHGCEPFPWQQALVDRLAGKGEWKEDEWPDVLDLPTGAGKTAALDVAVFHLALRVGAPQSAALRVAMVVDRRLVVDDAFARAQKIASALNDPSSTGEAGRTVVVEVADRLKALAGDAKRPLVAQRLRGGAPLEHDWARTPTQPTILCSTVDQVGSRLLFRGYGVSNRMKPVHAGLLGQDSLLLLDEAHLSEPFRRTLGTVRKLGRASTRTVLLSATPGVRAKQPFELTVGDRVHPVLKQRLEATKPARLRIVRNTPAEDFADQARALKARLHQAGISAPAVGVIVNRVDLAREIFQELRNDPEFDGLLMIGRSRDIDRDSIVRRLEPFRTGVSGRSELMVPLLVVATQCLEVGVDLDLDGLVTQAASLDALRQRFGRLNRAGRRIAVEGAILAIAEDLAKKADDPVYGDRIRKTWETLAEIAQDGVVDFGVTALEARLRDAVVDVAELAAPRKPTPVLMPAYLDLWSQTSPIPNADPEVGLFLHGAEHTPADVSFVWRSDISLSDPSDDQGADRLKVLMELMPPRAAEMIEVPLWSAKGWLRGGGQADAKRLARVADVPGRDESDAFEERGQERTAFLWAGSDDPRTGIVRAADIRPGDILVVPSDYGGCDAFGWAPDSEVDVADVADDAARPFRGRRHTVRVTRNDAEWDRLSPILAAEGDGSGSELMERFLNALPSDALDTVQESVGQDMDTRPARSVRKPLEALRHAKGRIALRFPYAGDRRGGVVFVAAQGLRDERALDLAAPATEDETHSRISSRAVSLDAHGRRVARLARRFARTLRLPRAMVRDLLLAGLLHDAGKADERFQLMLSGGDPWNRPDGLAMAKSGRPVPRNAWDRAGLPKGWRHEALSVRMARAHPWFQRAKDPALVLWLIGTHHGFGRPFFNFIDTGLRHSLSPCFGVESWRLALEPGPQATAFHFDGADWPVLFDELKKRYGIWKLAWLEAILRLADHRASEEEHSASKADPTS